MKVVIVMPYYNRQKQLIKSLLSFQESKHTDFEVVIIDDKSPEEVILPGLSYQVTLEQVKDKHWHNPDACYNMALKIALDRGADIIIVQNPECYHVGDIISYASQIDDGRYVTFSCFSLSRESTEAGVVPLNTKAASRDGQDAWYNHSIYRPVAYEFCAAMTARNMKLLNGYDERMMFGWGYSDNYFLARTKMLGLKTEIIDEPYVVHQWHYSEENNPDRDSWIRINKRAYEELLLLNNFRAKHLITNDL